MKKFLIMMLYIASCQSIIHAAEAEDQAIKAINEIQTIFNDSLKQTISYINNPAPKQKETRQIQILNKRLVQYTSNSNRLISDFASNVSKYLNAVVAPLDEIELTKVHIDPVTMKATLNPDGSPVTINKTPDEIAFERNAIQTTKRSNLTSAFIDVLGMMLVAPEEALQKAKLLIQDGILTQDDLRKIKNKLIENEMTYQNDIPASLRAKLQSFLQENKHEEPAGPAHAAAGASQGTPAESCPSGISTVQILGFPLLTTAYFLYPLVTGNKYLLVPVQDNQSRIFTMSNQKLINISYRDQFGKLYTTSQNVPVHIIHWPHPIFNNIITVSPAIFPQNPSMSYITFDAFLCSFFDPIIKNYGNFHRFNGIALEQINPIGVDFNSNTIMFSPGQNNVVLGGKVLRLMQSTDGLSSLLPFTSIANIFAAPLFVMPQAAPEQKQEQAGPAGAAAGAEEQAGSAPKESAAEEVSTLPTLTQDQRDGLQENLAILLQDAANIAYIIEKLKTVPVKELHSIVSSAAIYEYILNLVKDFSIMDKIHAKNIGMNQLSITFQDITRELHRTITTKNRMVIHASNIVDNVRKIVQPIINHYKLTMPSIKSDEQRIDKEIDAARNKYDGIFYSVRQRYDLTQLYKNADQLAATYPQQSNVLNQLIQFYITNLISEQAALSDSGKKQTLLSKLLQQIGDDKTLNGIKKLIDGLEPRKQ